MHSCVMYNCIGGSKGGQGRTPLYSLIFYFILIQFQQTLVKTRKHFSGMCTVRFCGSRWGRGVLRSRGYGPGGYGHSRIWSQGYGGKAIPPPEQTDTCRNITFPQLRLWVVIRNWRHHLWSWRLHLRNPESATELV